MSRFSDHPKSDEARQVRQIVGEINQAFLGLTNEYLRGVHTALRTAAGEATRGGAIVRTYRGRTDGVDAGNRTITCRIGSQALDRYRTVIAPDGIELGDYGRNPVILWEHGQDPTRGALPVGKCTSIGCVVGPNGPELIAAAQFFDDDEFEKRLWKRYQDRSMSAWSVNIIPIKEHCGPPTREEIRRRPELADCECMFRRSILGEFSCVAVGGNQEALTLDDARSFARLAFAS
jgi:hypothetical protein